MLDFETENSKDVEAKYKCFEERSKKFRAKLLTVMDLFEKTHKELHDGYKKFTKYSRILKINTGEIIRSDIRVTRSTSKYLTNLVQDLPDKEIRNWVHVYDEIDKQYISIYKKLSEIHQFNIYLFSELITTQLAFKIQCSKLSQQEIFDKAYPKICYKKAIVKGKCLDEDASKMCTICFGDFEDNWTKNLRKLPCGHIFHADCIDQWLRQGKRTCPFCRRDVFEREDAYKLLDLAETEVINRGFDDIEGEIQEAMGFGDESEMSYSDDSYGGFSNNSFTDFDNFYGLQNIERINDHINRNRANMVAIDNTNIELQQNFANSDLWEEVTMPVIDGEIIDLTDPSLD